MSTREMMSDENIFLGDSRGYASLKSSIGHAFAIVLFQRLECLRACLREFYPAYVATACILFVIPLALLAGDRSLKFFY